VTIEQLPEAVAIAERFPNTVLKVKESAGNPYVCIRRESLVPIMEFLRDNQNYKYFSECLGVDYSQWEHERDFDERFEVVYNLMSVDTGRRLFVKIGVNDGESIATLKHVFIGAEYPEKEVGDLFGIRFKGNELAPGERFLLPDDWRGYPLRKEYPLGGEDVLFDLGDRGPAVEDVSMPHAGESFEGKTGSEDVSGR
jgi:NADH-quinone oxidoreductase subunit C